MNNKLYIFDMDGTILDSMPIWRNLDINYLKSYNITPPINVNQITAPLTFHECADYFISLGVNKDRDYIISEMISIVKNEYANNVGLKTGMYNLLRELYLQGQTICILTSSDKSYAIPALKRLKIYNYFDAIYTCTELNLNKRTPEIYKIICDKYNTLPKYTTVYEDTLFAVNSAKGAGCHVVAVYDKDSDQFWDEIKQKADEVFL